MSPPLPSAGRRHFAGFNALRFISALAIIVYHSTQRFSAQLSDVSQTILQTLSFGVDLFFLISGFLIVYLLLAEKAATQTISLPKFYLRRVLRIFPLYFLILGLAYHDFHASNPEIDFGYFAAFGGNFWLIARAQWTISLLNPLWSVCIEEQFYLVIPLLILVLPGRRLPVLFVAIILLSAAFRYHAALTLSSSRMVLYCHPLSRADVLALGGLLACAHFRRPLKLTGGSWTVFLLVALAGAYCNFGDLSGFAPGGVAALRKYLMLPLLLLIFGGFVFGRGPVVRFLNRSRLLDYLGRISYGLYMFHSVVMYWLGDDSPLYLGSNWGRVAVVLLGTIGVATLSFELLEKPILRLKRRFEVVATASQLRSAAVPARPEPAR